LSLVTYGAGEEKHQNPKIWALQEKERTQKEDIFYEAQDILNALAYFPQNDKSPPRYIPSKVASAFQEERGSRHFS
jgi:hypothetical protein